MNPEQQRLQERRTKQIAWKKWGPYLSERQWGTVAVVPDAGMAVEVAESSGITQIDVRSGDVLIIATPGGGGYGADDVADQEADSSARKSCP